MDLRKLHYFITVAQEKNYSRAAKILHISQPSLSNAIIKLEEETGCQLLERNTRGLELTETGSIFYMRSVELLTKFNNMLKELEEMKQIGSGTISVGMIESAKFWFPKVINRFKADYANVHFRFNEILGQEKVIESLKQFDVHFTITNQPIKNEQIILTPIYNEKLVLVTRADDKLALRNSITLHDLQEKELIISAAGFQTRKDVLTAFKKENATPNIFYEIERFETACSLVEQGLGITIIPESYVKYSANPSLKAHSIESEHLERTVYLAYLKGRYLSPAVHRLFEEIKIFFKNNQVG
ncbi:LysR family transcriptional regulator [Neobacillus notoginsengisoli]|uniref:LysR family transcriptional regulator n=1 Tax=Neobacillus notoginsengisoli TaxID=1578198 RepID=A0A417YST3_9BACI|nr:LysR family transcriptional regulator [Neobacillus notoginsengisoli]RHW39006.1 LysR family transcriptional regulator [Neobacillus notoginsengisoli]